MKNMDRWLGDGGMPVIEAIGGSFDAYGDGWVTAKWVPTTMACNPHGGVQAGVYAVMLDAAMNFAINATLDGKDRTLRDARDKDRLCQGRGAGRDADGARRSRPAHEADCVRVGHGAQRGRRADQPVDVDIHAAARRTRFVTTASPGAVDRVDARRIALAAQGFGTPRPTKPNKRHLRAVLDRVAAVQIDAVNVLVRSHYIPFFSRLGPYDRAALDALTGPRGDVVEYWCHAACFVPADIWPLFAFKMRDHHYWSQINEWAAKHPDAIPELLATVRERGPVSAGDLEQRERKKDPWWDWTHTKLLLEYLFWTGRVTAGRRSTFERTYESVEIRLGAARVAQRDAMDSDEARRQALRVAARALGVGTARDIGEYVGLNGTQSTPYLRSLVADGELVAVSVEGVAKPCFLDPGAPPPKPVSARALVSPFDSLVWQRARARELFGLDYTIEIYVPKPKRVHGYYVLPFLLDERFAARVDLKADRAGRALLVQAAHLELGEDRAEVVPALHAELREMARWLDLDDIVVQPVGDLAKHLARA